ncbi:carbohydrate ABC transporter permease [Actinotalea solisilvae]|uniref:carbohydrate ABC transporter permease n=1 Tax=Actinotalea solisilvae TaxID=2072922 RepID=UPI0018F25904|nr:sugar ABC transporter permease [Actinotalea solisilvae]
MAATSPTRPVLETVTPLGRPDPDSSGRLLRRNRRGRWDVKISPYLYISPFFLLFALVGLFPLIYTAYVSLHDWHLIGGQGEFVGAQNYLDVLQQPRFMTALRNTFSIFLLSSVPQVLMAIVLAAVLDANLRAKTFWRMGVLLPYVVAPVAASLIFSKLFGDQSGMINAILGLVGLGPIGFHADPLSSHVAIASMVNFRWTGYNTLIFLAAMQAIPRDLYEAAVLDGASRFRQFVSVTVPMLRPTVIFVVITSTIGGLQIFDEPRMFDQLGVGGPDRQWMTVTMFLYELGWGAQKSFGRAAAVAWILFVIIVVIGLLNFALTRRIASSSSTVKKGRAHR